MFDRNGLGVITRTPHVFDPESRIVRTDVQHQRAAIQLHVLPVRCGHRLRQLGDVTQHGNHTGGNAVFVADELHELQLAQSAEAVGGHRGRATGGSSGVVVVQAQTSEECHLADAVQRGQQVAIERQVLNLSQPAESLAHGRFQRGDLVAGQIDGS